MKVPKFLQKEGEEDSLIEKDTSPAPTSPAPTSPAPTPPSKPPDKPGASSFGDKTFLKLGMEVDKIKAQVEAFSELRKAYDQRLQRISEEIGDLRRRAIDREKEVSKIRAEATRVIQLVEAMEPEKIMEALAKKDVQIEKIKAKEELDKKFIDNLNEEFKDLRDTVSVFKSTEELLKINDGIKQDLVNLKKTQAVIERHSSKVEQIFINVQQRFNDFERLGGKFETLENRFHEIIRESDKFRAELGNYAGKTEVLNLQNHLEDRLNRFEQQTEKQTELITEGYNLIMELKSLRNILRQSQRDLSVLKKLSKETPTRQEIDQQLKDMYESLLNKINDLENKNPR
ncbi:hypothetical protein ACFLRC_03185 [Candidatus Altiarchaeota archaeon]